MRPDPATIGNSALWHFYDYDPLAQQFMLLQITEPLYRRASFLDQRIEKEALAGLNYDLAELPSFFPEEASPRGPSMDIFHLGHCGSTLLSRALGASDEILPLREPLTLRRLANDRRAFSNNPDLILGPALRALNRNFHPGQVPVIKATSTCNNLILPILQRDEASRAILMYVPLEAYLAGMLGKLSPALDLRGHAAARLADWRQIDRESGLEMHDLDETQLAVLAWITSMHLMMQATEQYPDRVQLLDFEVFLQDPEAELATAASFFGLAGQAERILEAWPDISTGYSKKPDEPYSAFNRRKTLQRGRMMRGEDIQRGLEWAEEIAVGARLSANIKRAVKAR